MSAARISLAEFRADIDYIDPYEVDRDTLRALCDAVEAAQALAAKPAPYFIDEHAEYARLKGRLLAALAPFAAAPVDRAPGEEVR